MVSAAVIFQQTSCVIPQAVLLYRGREKVLPKRYFNLGRLGAYINALAVAWVVFLDVVYCFPTLLPATAKNMSYVSVVSAGLVAFVLILWFTTKRHEFKGPHVNHELMEQRRLAAIRAEITGVEVVSNVEAQGLEWRGKGVDRQM